MFRPLAVIVIIVSLIYIGCSGGGADDANGNANANSNSAALSGYTDANLALADGTKFLDEGELDKAIDALDQAVKLSPDLAEAWFKLGIAHGLFEIKDQTAEKETPATDEEPANKTARVKSNSEKAFEKAVTAYKKMIDTNDEDDVAHFNLGRAYNKLNDDEDAARSLKQAVKLKPDDTEYQTELGAILIKLAQYHEAIPPLKKALELDPENIRALELLEDAEAGRKRVNYSSTPKEEKKSPSTNSNADSNGQSPGKSTPQPGPTGAPQPRPTLRPE